MSRGRGTRRERGAVTVLLVFPLAALSIMLCAHTALVFHGRSVVAGAAQDALRAAQIENGSEGDGVAAANRILDLAPALANRSVDVDAGDETVTVTVTADIDALVPGFLTTARSVATGPRERFYDEEERG